MADTTNPVSEETLPSKLSTLETEYTALSKELSAAKEKVRDLEGVLLVKTQALMSVQNTYLLGIINNLNDTIKALKNPAKKLPDIPEVSPEEPADGTEKPDVVPISGTEVPLQKIKKDPPSKPSNVNLTSPSSIPVKTTNLNPPRSRVQSANSIRPRPVVQPDDSHQNSPGQHDGNAYQ